METLLEDAETVGRGLWGSMGQSYRREAEALTTGIREVVTTDPDKLTALCERLNLLVGEFRAGPTEGLSPPMHRFESELDDLRRLVYRSSGSLVGMDRAAWDARIADIERRAHDAYNTSDASGWRRVYNEVLALYETASQEEFSALRLDDPAYLTRRLNGVVRYANRVELSLTDFVPSAADEVRSMQTAERDRLLASLKDKVLTPIGSLAVEEGGDMACAPAKDRADHVELNRIEGALERIPSLGLVAERGGG